ncbi:type II secretion system F family protein [Pseudomonas sp. Pseusp122]|uniref:type II secretion system F family protein n=1 Tax=unclassified Pseudomonas TaxID=196821 RepID=UPI0039A45E0D
MSNGVLLLGLIFVLLLGSSIYLFRHAMTAEARERVLQRLTEGQPERIAHKPGWQYLERVFLQAGLGRPSGRIKWVLLAWLISMLMGYHLWAWTGLTISSVATPLALRIFISWRYRKRVRRMIEQLPQMLDYTVRSLKSGRTLTDAVLHGIEAANQPLKEGMSRIPRSVQLGVSLPDAAQDFADLYECDEFRLFALGLRVNHRYGGNASELMENLIRLIREREQAARQLRAMTGETRMTAMVLGALPVLMTGYFMTVNPSYMMHMWEDSTGQTMLMVAFAMQVTGSVLLWRMLRSI